MPVTKSLAKPVKKLAKKPSKPTKVAAKAKKSIPIVVKPDPSVLAEQFAVDVARLALETRCHSIVALDARGVSPITDFLVIATGTSGRQMKAVLDDIQEMALARGLKPIHRAISDDNWCLLDFVDVIVHVFSEDARHYYELETLWGEGKRIAWQREPATV